jgi:hypothetical protein
MDSERKNLKLTGVPLNEKLGFTIKAAGQVVKHIEIHRGSRILRRILYPQELRQKHERNRVSIVPEAFQDGPSDEGQST